MQSSKIQVSAILKDSSKKTLHNIRKYILVGIAPAIVIIGLQNMSQKTNFPLLVSLITLVLTIMMTLPFQDISLKNATPKISDGLNWTKQKTYFLFQISKILFVFLSFLLALIFCGFILKSIGLSVGVITVIALSVLLFCMPYITGINLILPAVTAGKPLLVSEALQKTKENYWQIFAVSMVNSLIFLLLSFIISIITGMASIPFIAEPQNVEMLKNTLENNAGYYIVSTAVTVPFFILMQTFYVNIMCSLYSSIFSDNQD